MTFWDFMYIIGCGVAFIMSFVGLGNENDKLPKEEQCFATVVCFSFFGAVFSWAVPIWWIGFEIYKRKGKNNAG